MKPHRFITSSKRRWRTVGTAGVIATVLLVASACSTKAPAGGGGEGGGGSGDLKTDYGVTDSTITLGALTDLSGVFAVLGKSVTQGAQLYFDQAGQICERDVELDVQDMGYDVQKAVSLYADMSPNVVGFEQLLGSPMNAALKQNIETDQMFTIPVSWASSILDNSYNMIVGTTYDIEMINGISYLMDQGMLQKGDSIGHIYLEGEFGENGFLGSTYAAEQFGLNLVGQKVTSSATDLTSQVTALKNENVKAIMLTTSGTQIASAAAVDASIGLNVPLLGNNPTWSPQLLDSPAAEALTNNFYLAASWEPFTGDAAGTTTARDDFKAKYPDDEPNGGVTWGYGAAEAYATVLQKACDNGDMTRQGLQDAFRQTTDVDTEGIFPTLDYSKPGDPPTRETIILQPDQSAEGGLKVAQDFFESETATGYTAPQSGKTSS